jgi:hypothetical protein
MLTTSLHSTKVCIHAAISLSGNFSAGKCIDSNANLLDASSVPWIKVKPDGSLIGTHAACGGLFRDHLGSLLGTFACNIGLFTVFNAEVYAFLLALEYVAHNGWMNVWLESDSTSALMVFKNWALVPVLLRNHWHNACNQGI